MSVDLNPIYVVDSHAHPPRKGVPGVDERPYIAPKTEEERELRFEEDLAEVIMDMDTRGVNRKVMLAMPQDIEPAFHFGEQLECGLMTYTSQQWIAKAVALYPERFSACACLNPLEESSIAELEDLKQQGFCEVKIHQAHYNIMANDKRAYPFYRECARLGFPVAFHTGFSSVRHIDRFVPTRPDALDDLACDIPDLKINMCHAGGNWYQDGVMIAMRNENIVVDLAGLPYICNRMVCPKLDPAELIYRICELLGPERVMFGTDNMDDEMNLAFMQSIGLSDSALRMVMGQSAMQFLEIQE